MKWSVSRIVQGVQRRRLQAQNNRQIARIAAQVEEHAPLVGGQRPVVFFNASSHIAWMSQNAAFTLLSAWGVRLAGAPVVHFVCQAGMLNCQLGTNKDDPLRPPPCDVCVAQSRHLYVGSPVDWFTYPAGSDAELRAALEPCSLRELMQFAWQGLPLGELVLPSLRWALRCHEIPDNSPIRQLLQNYLLSAWNVAVQFRQFLAENKPQGVVVFNGISFPEAVARRIAREQGLWVVTHEVGLQPLSGYFTRGQATAYPISLPEGYHLTEAQDWRLNAYLEKRMQGNFSMAGIQFWPEMRGLDGEFLNKARDFRQLVTVFTNVIFDTSQVHANVLFSDMFAWLDEVLTMIKAHPETLFVIRAHPDEDRPGKQARSSVAAWVEQNQVENLPNVWFVPPRVTISSYELIQRSKFIMVYNSTIGLEAAIMGAAVLCAGKARFTQIPTVFFPETVEDYRGLTAGFLSSESIMVPEEFTRNARLFLYYQLYKTSLPFSRFLVPDRVPGFVCLDPELTWEDLTPSQSITMRVLVDGLLHGQEFILPDEE